MFLYVSTSRLLLYPVQELCSSLNKIANDCAASHPNYAKYEHLLSPGSIPGRKVDNSDQQYSGFRDNLPYLILLLIFHPLSRRLYEKLYPVGQQDGSTSAKVSQTPQHLQADVRLDRRVRFDVGFACIYLLALHGASSLKVFVILYINYALAKRLPQSYVPLATWVFNIGILFANEFCKGYPYAEVARFLPLTDGKADQSWGSLLDSYGGLLPRWEIMFNITVLRLISFNLDYHWSLNRSGGSPIEVSTFSKAWILCAYLLIAQRRSNSTSRIYPSGTGSIYRPRLMTMPSGTTLHMFCTRPSTSLDPS